MMRLNNSFSPRVATAGFVVACFAGSAIPARANVYSSSVTINMTDFSACGTVKVNYILNEHANGTSTLPGVKIEVVNGSNTVVRTVTIARQNAGKQVFEWDGRNDGGTPVATGMPTGRESATTTTIS
jgi:flagellar hook assembly protein FlgD